MKRGAFWVISLIDEYTEYLKVHGVAFTEEGFPRLPQSCFLNEWPDRVVTYKYRNSRLVTDKRRTVLCLYAPDNQIFPRLDKVFDELGEYKSFISKILAVRPSKLLLYGKRDPVAESQLDIMGVNYRRYPDVHAEYKNTKPEVAAGT